MLSNLNTTMNYTRGKPRGINFSFSYKEAQQAAGNGPAEIQELLSLQLTHLFASSNRLYSNWQTMDNDIDYDIYQK